MLSWRNSSWSEVTDFRFLQRTDRRTHAWNQNRARDWPFEIFSFSCTSGRMVLVKQSKELDLKHFLRHSWRWKMKALRNSECTCSDSYPVLQNCKYELSRISHLYLPRRCTIAGLPMGPHYVFYTVTRESSQRDRGNVTRAPSLRLVSWYAEKFELCGRESRKHVGARSFLAHSSFFLVIENRERCGCESRELCGREKCSRAFRVPSTLFGEERKDLV